MHSLKDVLSSQFGSDEAFGLWFETDDGEHLTLEAYAEMANRLGDSFSATSYLADGGSGTVCTDYAAFIYKTLPGRVRIFGFANEENPGCQIAQARMHPGGHDFAVVDERYLVDPWCLLVVGEEWQVVYDMHQPDDAALVALRYGSQPCWTRMRAAEVFADNQMLESKLAA